MKNIETRRGVEKDSWDVIGKRDKYRCPECEYLGSKCELHRYEEEEEEEM